MGQKTADSDVRMAIAAHVAYLDSDPDEEISVDDLVARTIKNYDGVPHLGPKERMQLYAAKSLRSMIRENHIPDCGQWIVKDAVDDNSQSGFYGCVIDTRDGDAVFAFRGSEGFDGKNIFDLDMKQIYKDWVVADAGLLNSAGTRQQRMAEEFTRRMYEKHGASYGNINFSGHSLGGNLATHAALTAPREMPIGRCTSWDGPGFSDEYIIAHGADIARNGKYIDHYQYSAVGVLLTPIPGSNYRTIDAEGDNFGRHAIGQIRFDEEGKIRPGERDPLSVILDPLSKVIDYTHPLMPDAPYLAAFVWIIEHAEGILSDMQNQAEDLLESIDSTLQTWKKAIENWYRGIFGAALTGEYEMNVSYVNSLGDGMEHIARRMNAIEDEVEGIVSSLRYHSLSGSCYKSAMRVLGSSLGRTGKKAMTLGDAVRSCAQCCARADRQAAEIFAKA